MERYVVLACFTLCLWIQRSHGEHFVDKAMEGNFAKCAEEGKLTKDDIEKLKKRENLGDEKYKCLAKCVGQKEGMIDKEGKFSKEGAKKIAMRVYKGDPEKLQKAQQVAEECEPRLKDVPTSGCDSGPAVMGCLIAGAKEKKMMPEEKAN